MTGDDATSVGTDGAAAALDRIASIDSVEGRFGVVHRRGRDVRLVLAKNPAGWAAVFDLLDGVGFDARGASRALDQRPDGRRSRPELAVGRALRAAGRAGGGGHRRPPPRPRRAPALRRGRSPGGGRSAGCARPRHRARAAGRPTPRRGPRPSSSATTPPSPTFGDDCDDETTTPSSSRVGGGRRPSRPPRDLRRWRQRGRACPPGRLAGHRRRARPGPLRRGAPER